MVRKLKRTVKVKKKVSMNEIAIRITEREGKKVEVNIAQVKEILKVLASILNADVRSAITFFKYITEAGGK